ncbi:hypothetical protein [Dielma fastidiosa]|uniref:hypothetical protein n=1 Tax=Dielma fastidiosa TaxID=1034346 RepID=UPI000E4BBB00|nr:hypothetical protein [Dielma fastidiosa]RHN00973.1 hypothetical protein DWZ33_09095 [Dielma fastidiosa]
MPKGIIYKIPVDKTVFMSIVKECGSSIIKLGECEKIDCTERTIRRSLNEGKMTPCFLDQIAKHLDVDSRLLSGELHGKAALYNDDFLRMMYLAQLKAERYPYYRKRKVDLSQQSIEKLLEQILSVFDISFSQFEDMDFESQYLLQHDLFDALVPVIRKHFFVDAYGQKDLPHLEKIICDLENFCDDYYQRLHAEEVLRIKFLEHPPCGKTKADVLRMSAEDLIALDMDNDYGK